MLRISVFIFFILSNMLNILGQSYQEIVKSLQSENQNTQASVLAVALQSPDPAVQSYAIEIWTSWPLSSQTKYISDISTFYLKSSNNDLKSQILQNLGKSNSLCTQESQQLLISILNTTQNITTPKNLPNQLENTIDWDNPKELELREAIWVLIRWHKKSEFAHNALINLYGKSNFELQELILQVFSQAPPNYDKIANILQSALSSNIPSLRWQATFIVGLIGPKNDPSITNLLYAKFIEPENLTNADPILLMRTIEALGKIASPNDVKAGEFLWNLRNHNEAIVRIATAEALLRISRGKNTEGLKMLAKELNNTQSNIRLSAAAAILPYEQPARSWGILIQAAQLLPKEGIIAIGNLAANNNLTDPTAIEFLQRQYQQNPSERLAILSAFWQIHQATRQLKVQYFRELLQNERDPAAKAYLQQILQYGFQK